MKWNDVGSGLKGALRQEWRWFKEFGSYMISK